MGYKKISKTSKRKRFIKKQGQKNLVGYKPKKKQLDGRKKEMKISRWEYNKIKNKNKLKYKDDEIMQDVVERQLYNIRKFEEMYINEK